MKVIKIFLLLSLTLLAEGTPKIPINIEYKRIENVLINGWKNTDQNLTNWVEKDGNKFLKDFNKTMSRSLRQLTDEEYLKQEMDSYEDTQKIVQSMGHLMRSKDDYKKHQIQLMKNDIYYNHYKNRVNTDIYRYALVIVKYLENQEKYVESFNIYVLLLERLIRDINIHGKSFFQTTIWGVKEKDVFQALKNSLNTNKYTTVQKDKLRSDLTKLATINGSVFVGIMESERKFILSVFNLEFIGNSSFEAFVKYDAKLMQKVLKFIDAKLLKQYFEDKNLMKKLINTYMMKYDEIIDKLVQMSTKEDLDKYINNIPNFLDLLSYTDMTRLFVMNGLNKIGLTSLANTFQYELTEDEFIEVASQYFITNGKPWVFGKYKFEWEEVVRQNEELLDLSKN